MRELNELPHLLDARLAAAHAPAAAYCAAFPNPALSMCAKFVAFVVGAFAAALLALAAVDERILEGVLWGRNLLWYTALCGTLLALSRALITDDDPSARPPAPEAAMTAVVAHTHFMPRRWRNAAHTRQVHEQFSALFPYAISALASEVTSIFVAPALLWWSLPACAPDIIRFVREFTAHVEGVGHTCSLASFDFARHGSSHYGSPFDAGHAARSRQGKMEKSFLSFHAHYPRGWEPDATGRAMLTTLTAAAAAAAAAPQRQQEQGGGAPWGAHSSFFSAGRHAEPEPGAAEAHLLLQSVYEERTALARPADGAAAPPGDGGTQPLSSRPLL
jgi:autophagy-related protein 9